MWRRDQSFLVRNPKEKDELNPTKKTLPIFEKKTIQEEQLMEEVYTVRQNNTRYRLKQHDNR